MAFSAISIGGKRAYELARKGVEFEIEAKPVHIHELEIVSYEYPKLTLKVTCGSGTYIRSLGRDIAKSIGSSAVMTGLVRTEIGPFKLEQAVDLDQVDFEQLMSALQPVGLAVDHLPTVQLHLREVQLLEYGGLVEVKLGRVKPARISDAKIGTAKISAAKAKSPDETGDVKPTEDSTIDTTPGEIAAMNELGELASSYADQLGGTYDKFYGDPRAPHGARSSRGRCRGRGRRRRARSRGDDQSCGPPARSRGAHGGDRNRPRRRDR